MLAIHHRLCYAIHGNEAEQPGKDAAFDGLRGRADFRAFTESLQRH
jgi:hypothetical protein